MFSDVKVLLVKRSVRGAGDKRIHIEDFARVFGVYPRGRPKAPTAHVCDHD